MLTRKPTSKGPAMRENGLRKIWASGKAATNVWATIPSSYSTEIIAHQGWDSITVDTQHGVVDYPDMVAMLTAVATTPAVPLVRVSWNNPGEIMRAADAGAMGVICPTVNTKDECERFVGALRYAPMGYRSLGPNRARFLGDDYAAKANDTVLAIAGAYGLPVYVTENGIADAADVLRARYLYDHLTVLQDAIADGVADVRGYFHWTLTDNFEWSSGYSPRFALLSYDPVSGRRRFRRGGEPLVIAARRNGLTRALIRRFEP